jgi:hypothetical protein
LRPNDQGQSRPHAARSTVLKLPGMTDRTQSHVSLHGR